MPRGNEYKVIGGKGKSDGSHYREPGIEPQCHQQNVCAQQRNEDIARHGRHVESQDAMDVARKVAGIAGVDQV